MFTIGTFMEQASKRDDIIYVIGDFFDCHSETSDDWQKRFVLLKKLNSKVILILGNNEQRIIRYFFDNNFDEFRRYCIANGFLDVKQDDEIMIDNQKFFLTHKPKNHNSNMLNLFGHSHRAIGLYKSFGFNIGCDLNYFRLYSEDDVKHLLFMKNTYWDKDENLKLV